MLILLKKKVFYLVNSKYFTTRSQASFYNDKYLKLKALETDAQVSKDYGPSDKISKIW